MFNVNCAQSIGKLKIIILTVDLISIFFSVLYFFSFNKMPLIEVSLSFTIISIICLYIAGSYDLGQKKRRLFLFKGVFGGFGLAYLTLVLFWISFEQIESTDLFLVILLGLCLIGILCTIRFLTGFILGRRSENAVWVVIVRPEDRQNLKGEIDRNNPHGRFEYFSQEEWLEYKDNIKHKLILSGIVLAYESNHSQIAFNSEIIRLKFEGLPVFRLVDFYELSFRKVAVGHLNYDWFFEDEKFVLFRHEFLLRIKRIMDLALSLLIAILAFPIMLLFSILIRLESNGPIIYRQKRVGLNGVVFTIYKFRSMCVNAESKGAQWAVRNDSRVTKVGKFMRASRVDELPQLLNVILGDMSFIGPRPERPEFCKELEVKLPFFNVRHAVRPGITGWAQVSYPYGASIEDSLEKLRYDLYYIKYHSFLLDLKILLRTLKVVILGHGI